MGKKLPASKSLQGKKPINSAKKTVTKLKNSSNNEQIYVPKNPGQIGNKLKRSEMYGKYLQQKSLQKQERRRQRTQEEDDANNNNIDDDATIPKPTKNVPKTLDSMREMDITMIKPEDMNEILGDEADDEFAPYFNTRCTTTTINDDDTDDDDDEGEERDDDENIVDEENESERPLPKILITTRPHPSEKIFFFIADLQNLIPSLHYYPRKQYSLSQITNYAINRSFTHLIVLSEKNKICHGMMVSHLGYRPNSTIATVKDGSNNSMNNDSSSSSSATPQYEPLVGPTAYFKVSNVVTGSKIPHHGCRTSHRSEMNLMNFQTTRLGHRIGRLFASLFPIQSGPQFEGRQIVTFHNQRDYIFVRHHRYIFQSTAATSNTKESKTTTTTPNTKSNRNKDKVIPLDTTTAPTQLSDLASKIPVRTKLQELGPRFTLKLRWIQDGIIDENNSANSIYEYIHKRKEMDTSRRKFHL